MTTIGLDLPRRESQLCIAHEDGTIQERRIVTSRRTAHRASDVRKHVRAQLAVREALVRTPTRYTAVIKSLVTREGLRVYGSAAHLLREKITALDRHRSCSKNSSRSSR